MVDVIWFTQSVDGSALEAVHNGEIITSQSERLRCVGEAQVGHRASANGEWEFFTSWFRQSTIRGLIRPDRNGANGRRRLGYFKAQFEEGDRPDDVAKRVCASLTVLGIESSAGQVERFGNALRGEIAKTRRTLMLCWVAVALALAATVCLAVLS